MADSQSFLLWLKFNGNCPLNCKKDISNRCEFYFAGHRYPVNLYGKFIASK